MKKAVPVILIFLTAGCGNSLKHSWNNFTAYYNTFYNAKKNFETGLAKVNKQSIQIFPDSLVLPHSIPPQAGMDDFKQAKRDAIQLLRRFPTSKWADDALLLLGKTYYYQHEFFNAQQKFKDILGLKDYHTFKPQAVIWNGRILLNIHSFNSSIQFLKKKLSALKSYLKPGQKAEIQVLIAENQAKLGHWTKASTLLHLSLSNIHNHAVAVRGYYLLGQVLTKAGNFKKAFRAFSRVSNQRPDEPLLYWAGIKQVETARLAGFWDKAISICSGLASNENYIRRLSRIYYQQALNYKGIKDYKRSVSYLQKALESKSVETSRNLIRQIYSGLGTIYSKYLNNYKLAVAYFDSSSNQLFRERSGQYLFRNNKNSAYKRYAVLKKRLQRDDSLLELGALSERELHQKLIRIRNQTKQIASENGKYDQGLSILNNPSDENNLSDQATINSSTYGFLNYRNPQLVQEERQKFIAHWGDRPLADNWRLAEAVDGITEEKGNRQVMKQLSTTPSHKNINETNRISPLLKDIPRTIEERKKLKNNKLNDQYELANLFFLNFGKTDSASYYYHQILEEKPPKQLKAKTYYSLYKLFRLNDQPDSAGVYKHKILQQFPQSYYTKSIRKDHRGKQDTTGTLLPEVHQIAAKDSDMIDLKTALKVQELALKYPDASAAPAVYFESIRKYIRYVKAQDSTKLHPDSLQLATAQSRFYQGENWSSVRMMLSRFLNVFPNNTWYAQAKSWLNLLSQSTTMRIPTCKELDIQPKIIGGKEAFVKSVTLSDRVKKMNISGMVRFRLVIQRNGKVSSIKLLSRPTHLGIEPAYVKAIRKSLRFKPLKISNKWGKVSCDVSFPIKSSDE